jgi:hypothetical protein
MDRILIPLLILYLLSFCQAANTNSQGSQSTEDEITAELIDEVDTKLVTLKGLGGGCQPLPMNHVAITSYNVALGNPCVHFDT